MIPLPSISTLFPYTTLFRSRRRGRSVGRDGRRAAETASLDRRGAVERFGAIRVRCSDRKSTRLNSSHRCISYAVFCLKKKKQSRESIYYRHHNYYHLIMIIT